MDLQSSLTTANDLEKINIIGGGFSGLTTAFFLIRKGFPVRIFEKNQWGGLIQTQHLSQMQVESAANGFLNTKLVEELAAEIQCDLHPVQKIARSRYIFRQGLRRWPLGFLSTLKIFFWIFPQFLLNKKKLAPRDFETVESWALRVFNSEILNFLIAPALQGIYAGDVRRLSASLMLSDYFKSSSGQKSQKVIKPKVRGTVAPLLGMGHFIETLKKYLQSQGAEFVSETVENLDLIPGPTVLAVQPWDLQKIFDPRWGQLEGLKMLRVTVAWTEPCEKIPGFGVLFPKSEGFHSLGVLANSMIFSHRGSHYNESWILGGALSPGFIDLSDQEILDRIRQDRKKLLKRDDEISSFSVVRWNPGICHYTIELEKFLKSYDFEVLKKKNIFLSGNFLGQLGLSKILKQNQELADKITQTLKPSRKI